VLAKLSPSKDAKENRVFYVSLGASCKDYEVAITRPPAAERCEPDGRRAENLKGASVRNYNFGLISLRRTTFMLRQTSLAVLVGLALATTTQAGIMLTASPSAAQPGGGLLAYDLRAVSDAGEIINTAANPTILPNGAGMGLHQVWTPITNSATATRGDQVAAGILWSDTWSPWDSFWLFDATNSLSVGGAFNETNTPPGAVLPSAGFGAPNTGFGGMGYTTANASKLFTVASGLAGTDVRFAQLVMKEGESVLVSMGVLDTQGNRANFENHCIGACILPPEFQVDDLVHMGTPRQAGSMVMGGPLPTNDDDDPDQVEWFLESLLGPGGADATAQAGVDATGKFSWLSPPTAPLGTWVATIRGTNSLGDTNPPGTDTGTFTFNLVPEPGTIALLAIGMVGLMGIGRRRD
jgi:hypothetical protein